MNKSQLITYIQEIIYYLRVQNYAVGCRHFRNLLQEMQIEPDVTRELFTEGSTMNVLVTQMYTALEADDIVLLADLLEEALIPILKEIVIPREAVECGDYCLESTSSGYLTVKHLPSNLYLHTNGNPMEEARILVECCYDASKEKYAVWGCGLGYHIVRLYEAARGAVSIRVFDEDEQIISLALENGVLDHIPKEKITYVVDQNGKQFAQYLSEHDTGILLHFPSIKKIQNKALKDAIYLFFPSWNGTIQYQNDLAINFRSNKVHCCHNVDELAQYIRGKDVVLVAAGPSLDKSVDFLREASRKKIIVAVTTVLKKLLNLGIVPDYAVVMDAQQRTLKQIEGIESTTVPLLVDSTAYWEFAVRYAGEKYIAYQRGYGNAEKCAGESQNRLYETGGSVITLALDIVLQLGAKEVYFVGTDLAYPEGVSHAKDTMDRQKRDISGMEPIKAVNGGIVYANNLFIGYRKWIEAKIQEYPDVKFYNLSDCGAEIAGADAVHCL